MFFVFCFMAREKGYGIYSGGWVDNDRECCVILSCKWEISIFVVCEKKNRTSTKVPFRAFARGFDTRLGAAADKDPSDGKSVLSTAEDPLRQWRCRQESYTRPAAAATRKRLCTYRTYVLLSRSCHITRPFKNLVPSTKAGAPWGTVGL